ncbi:hypothetical protein NDU88_000079 [Pleurodeles waltl]|uniref:L1 transposable element RRM domain-containing protein n=1 Tax=Pleurodeles waltl TaxID=8319 RepID=A0AAV7S5U4_PLEWA|nr:hypothetical protein NDU88_000079 [Pleurodeles waltl]
MPGAWSSHKDTGKPAQQLLFSEAFLQAKGVPKPTATQTSAAHQEMADPAQEPTMDCILQEISAVGRILEGMDGAMVSMAAETKTIHTEIASFQTRVLGLEQLMSKVEAHASSFQYRDQELLFLRSKLTDLEDRSQRDNVRFVGFPENMEGEDLHRFLRDTLPRLTGITFDPPLEFQRAHRLGPRKTGMDTRPRPIIACLLRHTQARQLIQRARTQGPFQLDAHTIQMSADFSKETSDRRRAFLALRPRLCQLKGKYGLFEPARMWVTKNGTSKDFYDPEDLRSFLDGLSLIDSSTSTPHRDAMATVQNFSSQDLDPGGSGSAHQPPLPCPRGRDLERLLHSHDDRGQVLHAVALHKQVADRDKSCSPLKPLAEST